MKVYVDKQNMKLLGVEKERPFYTGDIFSSTLTVYFNTDVSNSSVTLSFLLANGRTPRKNLIPDDARTITLSEEKFGQSTWYSYTWELSAKEGLLVTPGPIQMTLTVTTNDVVEQVMFTNNVVRTSRFGANENLVVFGDDPEEIILDFATNIANINASLYKFRYIGEFNTKGSMYQAAFEEIYTNNNSMVSARFYDNVFIFLRSDAEGEQYLFMIDSSLYKYYKLKNDGTIIETDGANLSGFIFLTSATGTLSADQIENANKNLCYILYNNRIYQKNSSTIDSMTFVNYDLLYSEDVFNAARYTIIITISGNTYSYTSSSKLVETYTKDQINSLLNSKIYYNDVKNNLTSTDINKPLSANQGKVLKGLIDAINSDLSGNYLTKKPDGTNDIVSNGKVSTIYLPDFLLGQLLFGGTFNATSAVATLTTNAKSKLGINYNSIILTNDASDIYGYASNEGTFFVVEASGTFAGIEFSTGDWLISIGSAWKKVDNTDEVTSVNGQTGNVTTGTYDKPEGGIPASDLAQAVQDALNNANSAVQNHQAIKVLKTDNDTALTPGSSEEIKGDGTINLHKVSKTGTYADLIGKPTLGTAASHNVANEISLNNNDLITSGQLYVALRDMPVPMVFKGTLGQNATISSLPIASSENNGFTYKVVTAGTYAGLSCAVGDLVVSNGELWIVIPAGDEAVTEDTWRGIKVNGTLLKDNGITTGDVDFLEGANVTITTTANGQIIFSATDTTYDNLAAAKNGENVSLITTGDKYKILQSLYHLGAFDSQNGKTRQSWVIDLSKLNWTLYQGVYYTNDLANSIFQSVDQTIYATNYNWVSFNWNDTFPNNSIGNDGAGYVYIVSTSYPKGLAQYKLATPYTDTPIENESILPLDSNMANKIRQKVVDGLNLLNIKYLNDGFVGVRVIASGSSITLNGASNSAYDVWLELENVISKGTYAFNFTNTNNVEIYLCKERDNYTDRVRIDNISTITINYDVTYILVYFPSGISFSNQTIQIMLNSGLYTYPHSDFNQKEHITNDEALLLKQEEEKCRNLLPNSKGISGSSQTVLTEVVNLPIGTYTIKTSGGTYSGAMAINVVYADGTSGGNIVAGNVGTALTFTTTKVITQFSIYCNSTISNVNFMLNKGSEAKPYSEHYGELVHKKDLPTKLSDLNGDSTHRLVTDSEKTLWNREPSIILDSTTRWIDITNGACWELIFLTANSVDYILKENVNGSWTTMLNTSNKTNSFTIYCRSGRVYLRELVSGTQTQFSYSGSNRNRIGLTANSGYAVLIRLTNNVDNASSNIDYQE